MLFTRLYTCMQEAKVVNPMCNKKEWQAILRTIKGAIEYACVYDKVLIYRSVSLQNLLEKEYMYHGRDMKRWLGSDETTIAHLLSEHILVYSRFYKNQTGYWCELKLLISAKDSL